MHGQTHNISTANKRKSHPTTPTKKPSTPGCFERSESCVRPCACARIVERLLPHDDNAIARARLVLSKIERSGVQGGGVVPDRNVVLGPPVAYLSVVRLVLESEKHR